MKRVIFIGLMAISTVSFAEQFTSTEKIALDSIRRQSMELQQQITSFKADVEKAHPGFTVGQDGTLVEITKAPPKPKNELEKK